MLGQTDERAVTQWSATSRGLVGRWCVAVLTPCYPSAWRSWSSTVQPSAESIQLPSKILVHLNLYKPSFGFRVCNIHVTFCAVV